MNKLSLFLENARILSNELGVTPLLYGSLGLEYRTGKSLGADDIDILIPKRYITDAWNEFKVLLESHGYRLTDEHEHTFEKLGVSYSYADIEDLEVFAGIDIEKIETLTSDGTCFLLLSLEDYLKVYEKSVQDGYRIKVRQKKDREKIKISKEALQRSEGS